MPRKILLEYQYAPDFAVVGIFSPVKDYRLAWLMNDCLGLDMSLLPGFHWNSADRQQEYYCRIFSHEDPANFMQVYLLNNKTSQGILIPKPRNLDYLFLIKDPGTPAKIQEMASKIRGINQVQMTVLLNDAPDKAVLAFYYDLEMFLANHKKALKTSLS